MTVAVSLDVSAISTAQKNEKVGLQMATTREHSFRPRERLATTLRNVNIRWTAMPTAGTRPLFETRHLLTWEPGTPPASKRDWRLFGASFYSGKYSIKIIILRLCIICRYGAYLPERHGTVVWKALLVESWWASVITHYIQHIVN